MHSDLVSKTIPGAAEAELESAIAAAPAASRPISRPVVCGLVAALDGLGIFAAGMASTYWTSLTSPVNWHFATLVVLLGTLLAVNLQHSLGAYRFENLSQVNSALWPILSGWLLTMGTLLVVLIVAQVPRDVVRPGLLLWFIAGLFLLASVRLALYRSIARWKRGGRLCERIVIVGATPIAMRLLRHFAACPDRRISIVGIYDDRLSRLPARCFGLPILGTVDDLIRHARRHRIDAVYVALPLSADWRLAEIMNKLRLIPVDVRLCPDQFGLQLGAVGVSHVSGLTFLNVMDKPLRDWRLVAKQVEDRILAALILAMISPLMLLIAALIKLDSPGPALFRQKRYGYNNQLIEMYKFRTMYQHVSDPNAEQLTRRNDPRVTRIGAFLRRTSLDELPQFLNVLRGDMSIVGPRPHAVSAKAGGLLYQDAVKYYDARHRMKPGITGWAQVNGWRGETETVEQILRRVEHDLYYVENWSIAMDLRIICRTILGGFTGRYAY
jgi:Undecaprenyl-phosphate glucose phosphotransferase